MKRKINTARKKHPAAELHACKTSLAAKTYLCNLLRGEHFGIYSLSLNKRRVFERLAEDKARVYNFIARLVVDRVPFEKAAGNVLLTVDRSKGNRQRKEFNEYIEHQLHGRLDPSVKLDIIHEDSEQSAGLQLADLFAWGIHRKYERKDETCYDLFKEKVLFDEK